MVSYGMKLTYWDFYHRRKAFVPTGVLLFFRFAVRDLAIFGGLVDKLDCEIARRRICFSVMAAKKRST
jgi:hypothetical protein